VTPMFILTVTLGVRHEPRRFAGLTLASCGVAFLSLRGGYVARFASRDVGKLETLCGQLPTIESNVRRPTPFAVLPREHVRP
jgi:drug/metabolite transporter (DMT)-like permease